MVIIVIQGVDTNIYIIYIVYEGSHTIFNHDLWLKKQVTMMIHDHLNYLCINDL